MQYIPNTSGGSWFSRLVGALVGALVLVGLFFLGLTVFAVALGLAVVVFVVAAVRIWWLRRKLRRHRATNRRRTDDKGVTIEGEYEERQD